MHGKDRCVGVESQRVEARPQVVHAAPEVVRPYPEVGYQGTEAEEIERSVALETSNVILAETLPPVVHRHEKEPLSFDEVTIPPEGLPLERLVEDLERRLLISALRKAGGVKKRAAKILHLSFRSFRYRLEKYAIDLSDS